MKLWHFTCEHAAAGIRRDMVLKPFAQVQLDGRPLIWFTDLETPDRDAIGLTSVRLRCNRMEYRVVVDVDAEHWPELVRRQPRDFRLAARDLVGPASLPMHWFVTCSPTPVIEIGRVTP